MYMFLHMHMQAARALTFVSRLFTPWQAKVSRERENKEKLKGRQEVPTERDMRSKPPQAAESLLGIIRDEIQLVST